MVVAPMMVLVTKGREAAKAIAICAGIEPVLSRKRNIGRDRAGAVALLVAAKPVEQRLARAGRQRAAFIFAGEIALAERRIGEQAHLLAVEDLREPDLEGAVDEVVGVLDRDDAREAEAAPRP